MSRSHRMLRRRVGGLVDHVRRRRPLSARAAALGWRVTGSRRLFLDDLDDALGRRGRRRVAVLAPDRHEHDRHEHDRRDGRDGRARRVGDLLHGRPDVDAHTFDPDRDDLHVAMTAEGPFDVIVDDTPSRTSHSTLFHATYGHLRRGGTYLVRRAAGGPDNDTSALFGALAAGRLQPPVRPGRPATPEARLASTVGRIGIRGRHATVTSKVTIRVKVREDEAAELIRRRGAQFGETLDVRPAAVLPNRAAVRQSPSSGRTLDLPRGFPAPEAALRAYPRVRCAPGQVAWRGNVILADSFRHNMREGMHNKNLRNLSPRFARTPRSRRPVEHLPGAYFYLDGEMRGHYGHAMTEQLSRLWAWAEAKAADPGLRALLLVRNREIAPFEPILYAAAGIDPADLVVRDHAVEVDRLVTATPMFSQPEYVHPDLPALWDQVSRNLAGRAEDRPYPRRVFCSRRRTKRACTNAAVVEDLFAGYGFRVLYPEDYPLTEQARMFRDAEVIAGFAGSAMISTALCGEPKHVILVSSESYTAMNEHLIAAALGHRLDIAWCRPLRRRSRAGFDRAWFNSPFTFDTEREGGWLRDVLGALDSTVRPADA